MIHRIRKNEIRERIHERIRRKLDRERFTLPYVEFKDEKTGEIIELHCTYDPQTRSGSAGRSVKGTLHWVSAAHAVPAEVRLYDRLFLLEKPDVPNFKEQLNPASLEVLPAAMVERSLKGTHAFQYLAILHEDRVTGMRDGKRDFGQQIEIRCWNSIDARVAKPTRLSFDVLEGIAAKITKAIPEVVSVTYNITTKPPSTIEAV